MALNVAESQALKSLLFVLILVDANALVSIATAPSSEDLKRSLRFTNCAAHCAGLDERDQVEMKKVAAQSLEEMHLSAFEKPSKGRGALKEVACVWFGCEAFGNGDREDWEPIDLGNRSLQPVPSERFVESGLAARQNLLECSQNCSDPKSISFQNHALDVAGEAAAQAAAVLEKCGVVHLEGLLQASDLDDLRSSVSDAFHRTAKAVVEKHTVPLEAS